MTPEEWYVSLLPLLLRDAVGRFRVPFEDAEDIAHDAFLSFLNKCDRVRDPRRYLLGATSYGCRTYWRRKAREAGEPLPEGVYAPPPYVSIITAHRVLNALPPRYRDVLVLRAVGHTVVEIAKRISYSPGGAEKVVRRARKQAAALVDPSDETERRRVGGRVRSKDTHRSAWGHRGERGHSMRGRNNLSSRTSSEGSGWAGMRRMGFRHSAHAIIQHR